MSSLVLFVIVFCLVLPFTQIPWPLTPTTWKQLSTLTSQISGSVSPYLAARLVQLLRFTSSYRVPVVLPIPSSGAAASMLESATTSDRLSGHPSCPYCVVCPAPLFGLIPYPLSLLFLVYVLSINYNCPFICIWVPFLADPWQFKPRLWLGHSKMFTELSLIHSCCVLKVIVLLDGEPSAQSEVLNALDWVFIKAISIF